MKLVVVDWADACSSGHWGNKDELEKQKVPDVQTVGWVFNRTKEHIHLVHGCGPNYTFLGDMMIPIGMIKRIIYVGSKYDRKDEGATASK